MRFARLATTAVTSTSAFAILSQIVRTFALAVSVIVLARLLPADQYGYYAAATAGAAILAGLVGYGSGPAIILRIIRSPEASQQIWGHSLATHLLSGSFFWLLAVLGLSYFFPAIPASAISVIALTELLATPMTYMLAYTHQATGNLKPASTILTAPAIGRFTGISGAWMNDANGLLEITIWVGSACACCFFLGLGYTISKLGWPVLPSLRNAIRPNNDATFAASSLAATANLEVDKALSTQVLAAAQAGSYALAFRAASAVATLFSAHLGNLSPKLYAIGGVWNAKLSRALRKVALTYLLIGLVAAVLVWHFRGLLPIVFGIEYSAAATALTIICWWIPLYGQRQLWGAALTVCNKNPLRNRIDMIMALLLAGFCLTFGSRWGLTGLASASLACEALGCAAYLIAIRTTLSTPSPHISRPTNDS